jgi:(p)ppGpp synthase/HD superfamily hydrolase
MTQSPDLQRIAVLPLHAITSAYGQAGLLARLAIETRYVSGHEDRDKIARAASLAERLHHEDRRQGEPYMNHPLRVALRIMCHYNVLNADVICAALLHDAVEDHTSDLSPYGQDGAFSVLAGWFGPRVAALVAAVTNPPCAPEHARNGQYLAHLTVSLVTCPWARVIKVSDFTDNAVGLHHTSGDKATRLARKYAPVVPLLRDLISWPDTPLADQVKIYIGGQLDSAAERIAARLTYRERR